MSRGPIKPLLSDDVERSLWTEVYSAAFRWALNSEDSAVHRGKAEDYAFDVARRAVLEARSLAGETGDDVDCPSVSPHGSAVCKRGAYHKGEHRSYPDLVRQSRYGQQLADAELEWGMS